MDWTFSSEIYIQPGSYIFWTHSYYAYEQNRPEQNDWTFSSEVYIYPDFHISLRHFYYAYNLVYFCFYHEDVTVAIWMLIITWKYCLKVLHR